MISFRIRSLSASRGGRRGISFIVWKMHKPGLQQKLNQKALSPISVDKLGTILRRQMVFSGKSPEPTDCLLFKHSSQEKSYHNILLIFMDKFEALRFLSILS
ncbi:MAG: hypothetical protein D6704_03670 [Nitrospirae bacterium]|nr:MAG: hypothetical protein D6704_03670 [Nitrospirota bacterium]